MPGVFSIAILGQSGESRPGNCGSRAALDSGVSVGREHGGYCAPEGHLETIVARLLAEEPVELQRLVLAMVLMMKVVARSISEKD